LGTARQRGEERPATALEISSRPAAGVEEDYSM
jgi:hypothetical protein